MSPASSPPSARCTLKEAFDLLRISKASFYRFYRPADVPGEYGPATAGAVRDHYTQSLDIREVSLSGRDQLQLRRDSVLALRARLDALALGPLAFGRSRLAARLGLCAERGFGSRVRKDGRPRNARVLTGL